MQGSAPRGLTPAVSVVMPVRDAAGPLPECLGSIRGQTLKNWELIAVDDGSRDDSAAILAATAREDPRVRAISGPARGLVAALRTGLAVARAPLVARMDADDHMHPERLARQAGALDACPGATLIASRVRAFPAAALGKGMCEYLRWQDSCAGPDDLRDEIYVEAPFVHGSVVFRRARVLALGGYREGPFPEDYDLWLRLVQAGDTLLKLPLALLEWRQAPGSLSRSDPRYARAAFDRLRADYLSRDPRLASGRPLVYWGAGRRTRQRARLLQARGFAPHAWIDIDPAKIGRRHAGAPVHTPEVLADMQLPRPFVLVYVASHGARDRIAQRLRAIGYRRGADYLMVG